MSPVVFKAILFLSVLAGYQPFQFLGTVTAGVLRGIKDTQIPMMVSLLSYWGVGFSVALMLTAFMDIGAIAIWLGLAAGAAAFGMGMTARFMRFWKSSDEKRSFESKLSS